MPTFNYGQNTKSKSVFAHYKLTNSYCFFLCRSIAEYDREYRKVKASRKLKFLPTMGSVTLDLEFETRTLRIDVRPEAASIIALFTTRGNL